MVRRIRHLSLDDSPCNTKQKAIFPEQAREMASDLHYINFYRDAGPGLSAVLRDLRIYPPPGQIPPVYRSDNICVHFSGRIGQKDLLQACQILNKNNWTYKKGSYDTLLYNIIELS